MVNLHCLQITSTVVSPEGWPAGVSITTVKVCELPPSAADAMTDLDTLTSFSPVSWIVTLTLETEMAL